MKGYLVLSGAMIAGRESEVLDQSHPLLTVQGRGAGPACLPVPPIR